MREFAVVLFSLSARLLPYLTKNNVITSAAELHCYIIKKTAVAFAAMPRNRGRNKKRACHCAEILSAFCLCMWDDCN